MDGLIWISSLRDGPPYPTADSHLGQALHKILKGMVAKSKTMAVYPAPFVTAGITTVLPGCDEGKMVKSYWTAAKGGVTPGPLPAGVPLDSHAALFRAAGKGCLSDVRGVGPNLRRGSRARYWH